MNRDDVLDQIIAGNVTRRKNYEKFSGTMQRGMAQLGAGAMETLLSSPAATGAMKLVPNGLTGAYAAVDAGTKLLGGKGIPGGDEATRLHGAGIDQANHTFGVEDPKNIGELANRVLGGMVLPGPQKLTEAVAKLPAAARVFTDLVLPLNQSKSLGQLGVVTAVPVAINEAIADVAGDPNFTTLLDTVSGTTPDDKKVAFIQKALANGDNHEHHDQIPLPLPRPITGNPMEDFHNKVLLGMEQDIAARHEKESGAMASYVLAGMAAAGLAFAGASAARSVRAQLLQNTQLAGVKASTAHSDMGVAAKLKAATLDQSEPIFEGAKKAGVKKEDVQTLRDTFATKANSHANAAKVADAAVTGELPESSVRIPKLAPMLEAIAKLPAEVSKLYDDALIARTKRQQMHNEGAMAWGNYSSHSLSAIEAQARNNPQVRMLLDNTKDFYRGMRQYMHERGYISREKLLEFDRTSSEYVPTLGNFEKDPTLEMIRRTDPTAGTSFENMFKRNGMADGLQPGELVRPSAAHFIYMHHVISAVENNAARIQFVDHILQSQGAKDILKRAYKAGDNTFAVMRNGVIEHYSAEPSIIEALKHKPALSLPILGSTKRLMTEFTTGRFQPLFMKTAQWYENITAALARDPNRGTGLVSEVMNKMGVPSSTVEAVNKWLLIDPTILVTPTASTIRGMYSDMLRSASIRAEASILSNGTLSQWLGQSGTRKLADVIGNAYARSTKRLMDVHGAGSAPYAEHFSRETLSTDVGSIAPNFAQEFSTRISDQVKANSLIRFYSAFMENGHNAVRIQHFASNMRKGMSTQEMQKLAADTRRLTGDMSTHGGPTTPGAYGKLGIATQTMNSAIPWFNVSLQSARAMGRAALKNPGQFAGRLTTIGVMGLGAIANQMDNPIVSQRYWQEWTADQRADMVPIFDDTGRIITTMNIPQEVRGYWSALVESFGTLVGYKAGEVLDPTHTDDIRRAFNNALNAEWSDKALQDLWSGQKHSVAAAIPRPMPPIAGAGLAAAGVDTTSLMPWEGRFGGGWQTVHEENITGDKNGRVANDVMSAKAQQALSELIGAAGAPLMDTIRDAMLMHNEGNSYERIVDGIRRNSLFGMFGDRAALTGGEILWDFDKRVSTADSTQKLLSSKIQKMQQIEGYLSAEKRGPGAGAKPRVGVPDIGYAQQPTIANTALEKVARAAWPFNNYITQHYKPKISTLYRQLQTMPANTAFANDPVARRKAENDIKREIKGIQREMYTLMRQHEDDMGKMLGMPNFRYEDLDLNKLKQMQ